MYDMPYIGSGDGGGGLWQQVMYNLFFTLKFNLIFLSTTKHIEMDKGGGKKYVEKV